MSEAVVYEARAVRGHSQVWFHETGQVEQTDHFNVQLVAGSQENLRGIDLVRYMGSEMALDWQAMVVRQASHFDPLYIWQEGTGKWVLEIEAYVAPTEAAQPEVIVRVGEQVLHVPVVRTVEFPKDWGDLRTKVSKAEPDGWMLEINNSLEAEYVRQTIVEGVTQERRLVLEPGDHTLMVPEVESDYVGVSVSQRLPGGAELEHKHILRGRVDDGRQPIV